MIFQNHRVKYNHKGSRLILGNFDVFPESNPHSNQSKERHPVHRSMH